MRVSRAAMPCRRAWSARALRARKEKSRKEKVDKKKTPEASDVIGDWPSVFVLSTLYFLRVCFLAPKGLALRARE